VSGAAWRQDLRLWLPAVVVLALNLTGFFAYRVLFAEEAESRRNSVRRARAEHAQVVEQRRRVEALADRAEENQDALTGLYGDRFQTEEERITRMISEVKDLAQRAGLDPPTIRYPNEAIEEFGLVKRSIVFGVDGTYPGLRRFINFLELTQSFVTLEEIRPGERSGSRLSIDLKISTLFLDADVDPVALAASRDALPEGAR
jgi:Tfp pilus assembly protein PilO